MHINSSVSAKELKDFIETLELHIQDKQVILDQMKSIFADAKSKGFDTTVMREIIRRRKMEKERIIHEQELLDSYSHALGL